MKFKIEIYLENRLHIKTIREENINVSNALMLIWVDLGFSWEQIVC